MLQLKEVTYKIGTFSMGPINLSVQKGEYIALFGPSGSGKSLLLELIAGIRAPKSGSVIIDNRDVTAIPAGKRAVSMLFQDYALFPNMTVFDNIAFPMKMKRRPINEINSEVNKICCYLSIEHLCKRGTSALSGGEQQRVALARAIAAEPLLLLLDEPLSALDYELRDEAIELLDMVKRSGITIIHVTHNREEVLKLAHKTINFKELNIRV